MSKHHVLCDNEVRIVVWRHDDLVHVRIEDQISITFECELALLAVVIEDISVQLSHRDGYCRIALEAGVVRVDYALGNDRKSSCEVSREDFLAALA